MIWLRFPGTVLEQIELGRAYCGNSSGSRAAALKGPEKKRQVSARVRVAFCLVWGAARRTRCDDRPPVTLGFPRAALSHTR